MEKMTMTVREMASKMGISLPTAYELVKKPGFPTFHVGTKILIPIEAFKVWLQENTKGGVGDAEQ